MYNKVLDTYIKVVELGSFSKAAEELLLSRVAVMKQINQLEERLGIKLVERGSSGIRMTKAGESFYQDAKEMVRQSEAAIRRARKLDRKDRTIIRIGTSRMHPADYLLEIWEQVSSLNPRIKIKLVPFYDENLQEELGRKFDAVIGICDSRIWLEEFGFLPISEKPIACAMPKSHRLARRRRLQVEDLRGERVLMVKPGDSPVNTRLRREFSERYPDIEFINAPYFYNIEVFNSCVEQDCLLLSFEYWNQVHPMLKTIPVDWDYRVPYGIMYRKNPSAELTQFLDMIKLLFQKED